MDKQKQIEEMAYIICEMASKPNSCAECAGRKGGCFSIPKMQALYNAGYRKIPQNAVVLTREEYDEIKQIKEMTAEQAIESEKLKNSIAEAVNAFVRLETLYKIKCKELEIANEKLEGLKGGKAD